MTSNETVHKEIYLELGCSTLLKYNVKSQYSFLVLSVII